MPGKFEGEPAYAEHFYNLALEGDADDNFVDDVDRQIDWFDVDAIDADEANAPELENKILLLWEDSNGFIYTKVFDSSVTANVYLTDALGVDLD